MVILVKNVIRQIVYLDKSQFGDSCFGQSSKHPIFDLLIFNND